MSNPNQERDFYQMLDKMQFKFWDPLRTVFKQRWKTKTGTDWVNSEENGKRLYHDCLDKDSKNLIRSTAGRKSIAKIETGIVEEWDITLLCVLLVNFDRREEYEKQNESIMEIKNIRNFLFHHPTRQITFKDYMEKERLCHTCLRNLNVDKSVISPSDLQPNKPITSITT